MQKGLIAPFSVYFIQKNVLMLCSKGFGNMNSKKIGIIFIVIGISVISSFLIYPFLSEQTEKAVPVLKSFDQSSISETDSAESTDEIWEDTDSKPASEASLHTDKEQSETVPAAVFPIDINAATAEELMQIKGIGRVIAENIVSYRDNYGYFYSLEDLINVDGIGDKKLGSIRDYVYISDDVLPETAVEAQETVQTAASSYMTVTTVPQVSPPRSETQTSVRTTNVSLSETAEDDGGRIIEEITDFEDADREQSVTENDKTTDPYFSDSETASEEYYPNFPLELNSASAKDLAYINGIGETLAERIVEYARSYGFYDTNDLLNVSGIGQSKLNSILPYVYVDTSGLPPKTETATSSTYDIWNNGWETSYPSPNETTAPAASEIYKVNVNTAGKADFMQLPGIDETLADNIISLRSQIGGFVTIEELSLADGMTNSKLSAIWNYIYV